MRILQEEGITELLGRLCCTAHYERQRSQPHSRLATTSDGAGLRVPELAKDHLKILLLCAESSLLCRGLSILHRGKMVGAAVRVSPPQGGDDGPVHISDVRPFVSAVAVGFGAASPATLMGKTTN